MSSSNIGQRVGAAYNQAATLVASTVTPTTDLSSLVDQVAEIAADLVYKANELDELLLAAVPSTSASTSTTVAPAASGQQLVEQGFPGTTEQAFDLKIKGTVNGPIPAYLVEACQELGIDEVWDNRNDLGPAGNRPHFKSVKDVTFTKRGEQVTEQYPFWPPKGS